MASLEGSPLALAVSFIDAINRGDVGRLAELMDGDYELRVFDEPPQRGRGPGIAGWRGYLESFPNYLILPRAMAARGDTAAILGTATGSHLGLADAEEMKLSLIWLAQAHGGKVRRWTLIPDTAETRERHGLA